MEPLMIECRCCCKSLVFKPADLIVTCPACTTVNTRPRAQGAALDFLRRATQQRSSCDFVNAERSYQHVLLDHPDEHEALWGLVLCRYGVEYVPDSHSGKHLPTVHFIRRRPMREDADFLHACELAPQEVRAQYEADAAYVDEVHSKAYSLSRTAQPWDIFLCYKATDPATRGDTPDLHRARELYYKLGQQGWRVFFAHDCLQSKAGASYEAPIYHALSTARVMLIVCSDSEWLKTSWVHSEWSRYLERMDAGEDCHLVPLLYGMNPARLPTPFLYRHIEGLRMGELDAFDHLRTVLNTYVPLKKPEPQKPDSARELLSLQFALEDGSWERARTLSEAVLDRQPDNAMAHLYQLLAQLELHAPGELRLCHVDFQSMSAWKRACRFATESEGAMLETLLNGAKAEQQKQEVQAPPAKPAVDKQVHEKIPEKIVSPQPQQKQAVPTPTFKPTDDKQVDEKASKKESGLESQQKRMVQAPPAKPAESKPVHKDEPAKELILADAQRLAQLNGRSISAAVWHTVALKHDGTVVATGDNGNGQCDTSHWRDIIAVAAGQYHTVGLKYDGTVVAVGGKTDSSWMSMYLSEKKRVDYGQLDVNGWNDIIAISTGTKHTVGLKRDGTCEATGSNEFGQCNVSKWNDIVAISAGRYHTMGLHSDGTVVVTGTNYFGECDVGNWKDIVAISVGSDHSVGLKRDGTVIAAGSNDVGQCDVRYWHDIVAIAASFSHTVGLMSDGTVVATGENAYEKCNVENWKNIIAISAACNYTIGLTRDGTVVATGSNGYGQCNVKSWRDIRHQLTLD